MKCEIIVARVLQSARLDILSSLLIFYCTTGFLKMRKVFTQDQQFKITIGIQNHLWKILINDRNQPNRTIGNFFYSHEVDYC